MAHTGCIGGQELQAYLLGYLAETQAQAVSVHLESCSACEHEIEQLDSCSDRLLQSLQRFLRNIALPQADTVDDVAAPRPPAPVTPPMNVAGYELLSELGLKFALALAGNPLMPSEIVPLKPLFVVTPMV